ncbi:MAG TPA: transporter [Phenylobacterium sp.]|nr:transporter [Phenylobacterium sp.]
MTGLRSLSCACGVLLAALGTVARAQPASARPLCADRPGKATPPCILDVGRLQVEAGLFEASRERRNGARDDLDAYGGLELRAGLTRWSEFELSWTPWTVERAQDGGTVQRRAGMGDVTAGFRAALTDPDRSGFALSVRPFLSAPTATHHMGAGGWQGGVSLPASRAAGSWTLGATPELDIARNAGGGGTHLAGALAVAASRGLGPLTLGAELWAAVDDDPLGRSTQASFDLTSAWTPAADPELQLDAGVNLGLNGQTPGLDVYLGLTRRF